MRSHTLDRAPSPSSLNSLTSAEFKILPEITHRARRGKDREQKGQEEEDVSPETDYESPTSSDEEDGDEDETPPQEIPPTVTCTTRPEKGKDKMSPSQVDHSAPRSTRWDWALLLSFKAPPRVRHSSSSSMSLSSCAWYEFDLAVVVALVSPIGNWLTGGDHIKNLLFIVLLIFYLHQLFESTSLSSLSSSQR